MICHSLPAGCSWRAIANDPDCLSAQDAGHRLGRWRRLAAGVQPDPQPLCQQLKGGSALLLCLLCVLRSTTDVSKTLTMSNLMSWTGGGQP
jgi:hypothetical protein